MTRETAFDHWWYLTCHNGVVPRTKEALAREAYYAAWGGSDRAAAPAPAPDMREALQTISDRLSDRETVTDIEASWRKLNDLLVEVRKIAQAALAPLPASDLDKPTLPLPLASEQRLSTEDDGSRDVIYPPRPSITVPFNPCLAKLRPDEPFFVLLGRDKQAPESVRCWADARERAEGKTDWTEQARDVARQMESYSGVKPLTDGRGEPVAWPDDKFEDAVMALIRKHFDSKVSVPLTCPSWKDGIDIERVATRTLAFTREILALPPAGDRDAMVEEREACIKAVVFCGECDCPNLTIAAIRNRGGDA